MTASETLAASREPPAWQDAFLDDVLLAVRQGGRGLPPAEFAAVQIAVGALTDLLARRRQEFPLVLLAGFVTLEQEMCRQSDPNRLGLYRLARRALDLIYATRVERSMEGVETSSIAR